jgi:hypothetical protein
MLSHFLRGLWDSDGSWQIRGSSVRAKYTSASKGFVEDLRRVVGGKIYSWTSDLVKKGAVGYHLELTVAESRKLAWRMYPGSRCETRCRRKFAAASLLLKKGGQ